MSDDNVIETEVVENEDGEVMFDPNREVSDEEALATLESSEEEAEVSDENVEVRPNGQSITQF